MNKLVLFAFIAASAQISLARPDVSHGYRYQPGYSSSGGNLLQSPLPANNNYFSPTPTFPVSVGDYGGSSKFISSSGAPSLGYNSGSSGGFSGATSTSNGFGSYGGGVGDFGGSSAGNSYQSGYVSGNTQSVHYSHQASNFVGQKPIVTKHFWLHSAPEDHDEQQIVRYINVGQPRKNYNVVFINTPSSNVNKAKIIANVAPVEDKTAIYVLAKKANALDVSAEVATPAPSVSKPEVFFIKYKTPDEALHAQHTIQAQYDALGGSSNLSNEGTIPVSSAIGSLGDSVGVGAGDDEDSHTVQIGSPITSISNGAGDNGLQNYLPPNHK
ncbi:uncharacterized protein LOC129237439 [Anastrepha obliqua]|uniref:uncharacterized protein LOC129237439 n=1 Tax=Anastrepha obliqua TaxID=95512 RepID=UPI002409F775|nr:uncharacterized protein LOC129237439 [Anastrepha obliqua]